MTADPSQPDFQAPQIALPSRIPIMPLPTMVDLDILETPGGPQVGMRIQDPGGVKVVTLTPEAAKQLGENLRNAGTRAAIGLIVPSAKLP